MTVAFEDDEPTVIVDPTLEAEVVRTRMARGTRPQRAQPEGRLPLEMIERYLRENFDDE